MSLATMMRHKMQVLKADATRQHGGAYDFKWDTEGTQYACDLQPIETSKRITFGAMEVNASHFVRYDPTKIVLTDHDRLKVFDRDNKQIGKTWKVVTREEPAGQKPGWPAKAYVAEAHL